MKTEIRKSRAQYAKIWRNRNKKRYRAYCRDYHRRRGKGLTRVRTQARKKRVLTHYSPGGRLGCSWLKCPIRDLDMLSLDHIKNDGHEHRKVVGAGGEHTYRWIEKYSYPRGFQTLCYNHQMKKEILHRFSSFSKH